VTSVLPVVAGAIVGFRESFVNNARGWPDDASSTAWFADGGYRLATREPGHFVAIRAPGTPQYSDVAVSGAFRKLGGPPGGGYGLIVRDQTPAPLDGLDQQGHYYVFEVGDRGEFGVWRRDGGDWVPIVPWTRSAAVRPGTALNQLEARAQGTRLEFTVNGTRVASQEDLALPTGCVGLFAGGDGNDVLVTDFAVQPFSSAS
jgi:hypothetical protein